MRSLAALLCLLFCLPAAAQDFIPRRQGKPPGPPKSPAQALAAMTVPEGFTVELVAAEPDLVNPVAMTIDERGRFWVTESLEYPRHQPGPGRDRIKILEDTDGDGKVDKTSIFADGLNIPSGIAVGYGGVWVANAPDILFLQDTDGDGKADKQEVVVTGFGRDDTHELPNSLTWGPDGWLYGLNGVFNPAHIVQNGKTWDFTCAVWRIHPRTREFQLFSEGTSNPWGIAFNNDGALFVSACVIDHLWHLAERGYYRRQGGPYPPHTWILESIVKHPHYLAAYCGIHYSDSDAYPPEWRNVLFMGNIHEGAINTDVLEDRGSSYFGKPRPNFLEAHDVWFMPVVQKTGPDGCLYVLDWYDRYHCYQDASADPQGVDRLHGRLYRVRYKQTPHTPAGFDLAKLSDDELVQKLGGGNDFLRDTSRRLLAQRLIERRSQRGADALTPALQTLTFLQDEAGLLGPAQMNALWALLSGDAADDAFLLNLMNQAAPLLRAWGVRAAGNRGDVSDAVRQRVAALAADESPNVRLQVAVAAPKLVGMDAVAVLVAVLQHSGDDALIPAIVWQNLKPRLDTQGEQFLALVAGLNQRAPAVNAVLPRVAEVLLSGKPDPQALATLVRLLGGDRAANRVLRAVLERVVSGEIAGAELASLQTELAGVVGPAVANGKNPLHRDALLLSVAWGDANRPAAAAWLQDAKLDAAERLLAAEALLVHDTDGTAAKIAGYALDPATGSPEFRSSLLAALGRSDDAAVAGTLLALFKSLPAELQPRAAELLTQRPAWAARLVAAVAAGTVPKDVLNVNQIRRLVGSSDTALATQATAIWGTVREGRNPGREKVIADVKTMLAKTPGDPHAGIPVFKKLCGQCHKIYGEGQEVGPDITGVGRNNYDQLLSNVLDPSLVIGAGYQARTVVTTQGRVLAGLVVEDTPQRLVLKIQGGKTEAIPRDQIDEDVVSDVSLMPEGIETQLTPQELADLFAFLALDRPPSDPEAQRLPGAPEPRR